MSDTTELVKSTIDKVLERVDVVSQKLGIAATAVWGFTVKANVVNAWRDIASYGALLLLPAMLFCWSGHVLRNPIPRDGTIAHVYITQQSPYVCPPGYTCQTYGQVEHVKGPDGDISGEGWWLIVSAVLCAIAAIISGITAVGGIITGISCLYTAEYDAYQDLINDWKD